MLSDFIFHIQSLKQYGSRTSLSLWVEDVGKTNLLKDMAQMRYDDDQSYLNSKVLKSNFGTFCIFKHKGRFAVVSEFLATCNVIDPLKVDNER